MTKTETSILESLLSCPANVGGIGRPAATLCAQSLNSHKNTLVKAARKLEEAGLVQILEHRDEIMSTLCAVPLRDVDAFLDTGKYELA